jgi:hypothetical protein
VSKGVAPAASPNVQISSISDRAAASFAFPDQPGHGHQKPCPRVRQLLAQFVRREQRADRRDDAARLRECHPFVVFTDFVRQ